MVAIGTGFDMLAIFKIVAAERSARALNRWLTAHRVKDIAARGLQIITVAIGMVALCLIGAIWWFV